MELWLSKFWTVIILFCLTLCFGLLPVALIRRLRDSHNTTNGSRTNYIISLLNCIAGGVFLGTTFLHLLPDVQESMGEVMVEADVKGDYRVAELIICAGFFLIMFVEHFIMAVQHCHHHHNDVSPGSVDNNGSAVNSEQQHLVADADRVGKLGPGRGKQTRSYGSSESLSPRKAGKHSPCNEVTFQVETDIRNQAQSDCCYHNHQYHYNEESSSHTHCSLDAEAELGGLSAHVIDHSHHHHQHTSLQQLRSVRSFVLLLALSLHTVFEGLALGLQTSTQEVWTLFAALAMHKSIIAFTLGVQFTDNVQRVLRIVLFITTFSLMSPLGIITGTLVTETSSGFATNVANAVLQGLATGTFLHVTFFEVLQRQVGQDHNLVKVLTVLIGFCVVALMNLLVHE